MFEKSGEKRILRFGPARYVFWILLLMGMVFFYSEKNIAAELDLMSQRSGMSVILYNSTNGMSTSEANDIIQTSDGFIYVACYSGLFRYDGRDFVRIGAEQGVNSCIVLYQDSKDRLWVGTNDGGVALYQRGEFIQYTMKQGLESNTIRDIVEDVNGDILIATASGLSWIDPKGEVHSSIHPNLKNACIEGLYRSGDTIYGNTVDGSIFLLQNKKVTAFFGAQSFDGATVTCIYPEPEDPEMVHLGMSDGSIYYGNIEQGLKSLRKVNCKSIGQINGMNRCGDYFFALGTKGIGCLDHNEVLHELTGFPLNNSVKHAMQDYEGNYWFTSTRQGVMEIMPNRFTDIFARAGLEKTVVNATCTDRGMLYVGTDNGLILLNSQYRPVENHLTRYLKGVRIRSIMKDRKGDLWFAVFGDTGLLQYTQEGKIKEYGETYGVSNRARTVAELQDGSIAVSAGGVSILKDGKLERKLRSNVDISNAEILTICAKPDGGMYLGSDGDGIYNVQKNGSITHIGINDGLSSGVVLRIKHDPKNDFYWIVTSNSIGYMKDERIVTIRHFPNFNNFDLFPDKNGNVWVLSSNGVYIVREEDLLKDEKNMAHILNTINTGLPCIATANSRSELTRGGDLYIAGTTGVALVNIHQAIEDEIKIKTAIPSVNVDGQEIFVNEKSEVTIPAYTKRLSINPYVLTYALKDPRVTFQLFGFDGKTVNTTRNELDTVSYTNLPGKSYTFHFSIIDPLTGENESEISLKVHKQKKLHEQIWFQMFLMLLLLGTMGGIIVAVQRHADYKAAVKAKQDADLRNQIITAFAKCIDYKDRYTRGHSFRVADYTVMIARAMKCYTEEQIEEFKNIALLHDIGKISIPDAILNKPGKLTEEEYEIMKGHAKNGAEILKEIRMMPDLAKGAMYHHRHYDGEGYPREVAEDQDVPMVAQIIAVADSFDAMYSTRVYRKKMKLEDVIIELEKRRGTWYNPEIVDAFLGLLKSGEFVESHAGEEMNSSM